MFRLFKRMNTEEFSVDEQKTLIQSYLSKANEACYSFELNRRPYMTGGIEDLDKLISDLSQIRKRIDEVESKELIEQRNFWREVLEDKNSSKDLKKNSN